MLAIASVFCLIYIPVSLALAVYLSTAPHCFPAHAVDGEDFLMYRQVRKSFKEKNPKMPKKTATQGTQQRELEISNYLAEREFGIREVVTPIGYVDVLTHEEIIEVKHYTAWKQSIGQVLCYQTYFPGRQARIHLFGKVRGDYYRKVYEVCRTLKIRLTLEQDYQENRELYVLHNPDKAVETRIAS